MLVKSSIETNVIRHFAILIFAFRDLSDTSLRRIVDSLPAVIPQKCPAFNRVLPESLALARLRETRKIRVLRVQAFMVDLGYIFAFFSNKPSAVVKRFDNLAGTVLELTELHPALLWFGALLLPSFALHLHFHLLRLDGVVLADVANRVNRMDEFGVDSGLIISPAFALQNPVELMELRVQELDAELFCGLEQGVLDEVVVDRVQVVQCLHVLVNEPEGFWHPFS
mmetsp:Transcript_39069/g.44693  ORF Transcript_39069/g.44693 Transcript_39069/m.44693 type:complete len:225 (+) Transcript_39069:357-1031(+)